MNKLVSKVKNMVTRDPHYAVRGPVMQGQRFDTRLKQHMHTLMFELPHGQRIPADFGYFVEIEPKNTNKATCIISITPYETDPEGDPTFLDQVSFVDNLTEFICKAKVITQIVPKGTAPLRGTDIWNSRVEYYDEYHDIRTTEYVLEANIVTSNEWDNQLNESHPVSVTITQTEPTSLGIVETTPGTLVFRSKQEIKCGWWAVREENMSTTGVYNYTTNENYYWPPVLTTDIDLGDLTATRDGVSYIAGILMDYNMKEAYSGPCRCDVTVQWSLTAPSVTGVEQLIPESIKYQGIFVNFNIPKCLHPYLETQGETVATHPVLDTPQTRPNKAWPATKKSIIGGQPVDAVDWPQTIVGAKEVKPYKGGYLLITKTYHSPNV